MRYLVERVYTKSLRESLKLWLRVEAAALADAWLHALHGDKHFKESTKITQLIEESAKITLLSHSQSKKYI
jgi:hypothetical protein